MTRKLEHSPTMAYQTPPPPYNSYLKDNAPLYHYPDVSDTLDPSPSAPVEKHFEVSRCLNQNSKMTAGSFLNIINYHISNTKQCVGLYISYIEKRPFICSIESESPFASTDLRSGDHILEINNKRVMNASPQKIRNLILSNPNGYILVQSRPFHKIITLSKDINGKVGITVKNGVIVALHNNSDILRSKLIGKMIVEINGVPTLGLNDEQLERFCSACPNRLTLSIVPPEVYKKMLLMCVTRH
ncbi:Syntenin-2 [Thelohanellus kitauei]|uniref:Syntenin-2 n=1 Tax=Thelohanellus kitauei TaxID=669202 RepID=A0A0C2N8C3_THEKT|nr:Syntenin-2 [Thelohanellus kitauei]